MPYDDVSKNERKYSSEFLRVVLPALPRLRDLCITVKSDINNNSQPGDIKGALLSSSQSLRLVTIQFVVDPKAFYRVDFRRKHPDSQWTSNTFNDFQWQRNFDF
ncbi:hypothetical protein FRC19_007396 [Serendipita sp. 401]|nr:hypothetical protein FRC15_006524 [Serendipita sp. 397]KAG8821698.1 hypothetical protein FRC19_007396 [Serendipita sp. 401]